MTRDKQLRDVDLDRALEKRRLDQALNAKEFAVVAGISYSAARAWFRLPGFPVIRGVVFWGDFVRWRQLRTSLDRQEAETPQTDGIEADRTTTLGNGFPPRAAKLLAQAG